jgi:hypothetical protein
LSKRTINLSKLNNLFTKMATQRPTPVLLLLTF